MWPSASLNGPKTAGDGIGPDPSRRCAGRVAWALALVVAWQAPAQPSMAGGGVTWEQWSHLSGAVDVGGPRGDGNLVVAAGGRLFVLSPSGAARPLGQGPDAYATTTGEPYFSLATGAATRTGCRFPRDDVYAMEQGSPPGVVHVDAAGRESRMVSLPMAESLSGIAFDTTGHFGHQLLVTAARQGHGVLLAVDCTGQVTTITDAAPAVEGGVAVAPESFGPYAGDLIAVSEVSGTVVAFDPGGGSQVVVASDVPAGPDTGVESVGFIPVGFTAGGRAYVADRGNQPQPHPGTDTVLRISSTALDAQGVHDGDLLAVTEGGGITIDIACSVTCSVRVVAAASSVAHVEGHIVAVAGGVVPASRRASWGSVVAVIAFIVALALLAGLVVLRQRTVRGTRNQIGART